MRVKNDDIVFSTGKRLYANNGVIGLSPDLDVFEGCDGGIDVGSLIPAERRELAEYMIVLWTQFMDKTNASA